MADTDTTTETQEEGRRGSTVPADEMDVYRGWTSQQGPEPEPLPSTGPQKFVEEQLPANKDILRGYGDDPEDGILAIPENQLAESEEELDPLDRVRLGNTEYTSPLGPVANPEGAHIPGESTEPETIRAAPELAQQSEGGQGSGEGGEGGLESMTKAELEQEAERQGVYVTSSMTKADMIAAIEAGPQDE